MKYFDHINARTLEDAGEALGTGKARVIAGGTDLLGELKDDILPEYPEKIVNLKTIDGLDYIKEDDEGLKIGAMTKLTNILEDEIIKEKYPALAKAAHSVATPLIRNLATLGGNLCQDVRCWYYRYPHEIGGRMECARKGGDLCYAMQGDNRYHSIFGGMKVHETPCTAHCPAGTDIPGYMSRLRAGDITGAAHIIMQANPIPAITSRVCAHFCQEACNRNTYDENVGIGAVERFVGDYILEHTDEFYTAPEKETGKKVTIVGSGPGGLSAAFFLRKAGHAVTVIEKMEEAGGLLTYAIPAYRLPKEYVQRTVAAFEAMGIKFQVKTEVGKDLSVDDLVRQSDSVFFDTGAWKRRVIGIKGEELTSFGLEFLMEVKQWMKDKPGTDVLVVGGGNVAIDVAITAKRLGASKVTMVCLESEKEMPATQEEINRAKEEGIAVMPSWGPAEVLREDGQVTGMELIRCTAVFDEDGRFSPVYDKNVKEIVRGDSILMAIGQSTDLSFLGEKFELEIKRGLIAVDENTKMTSRPGIFAVGEVTSGPSTVVQAVKDGHVASEAMNDYMGIKASPSVDIEEKTGDFLEFDPGVMQKSKSVKLAERPADERAVDIEDTFGLEWDAALAEAKRCFNCGCLAVNASDIAPVLIALNATVNTTKRSLSAEELFTTHPDVSKVLDADELVIGIVVPSKGKGFRMGYDKFRLRESVDFAVLSVASTFELEADTIKSARVVLGAVAPVPVKAVEVEEFLAGKTISEEVASSAADLAVKNAIPLEKNLYKVQVLRTLVKRAILDAC